MGPGKPSSWVTLDKSRNSLESQFSQKATPTIVLAAARPSLLKAWGGGGGVPNVPEPDRPPQPSARRPPPGKALLQGFLHRHSEAAGADHRLQLRPLPGHQRQARQKDRRRLERHDRGGEVGGDRAGTEKGQVGSGVRTRSRPRSCWVRGRSREQCLRERGGTTRACCGLGAWPKWPRLDLKRRGHEKGPPRWRGGARRRDLRGGGGGARRMEPPNLLGLGGAGG